MPTIAQRNTARRLLGIPDRAKEDNIRQNISRLLDELGMDNIITYRTGGGPADL